MQRKRYLTSSTCVVAFGLAGLASAQVSSPSGGQLIAGNTPGFVRMAKNVGHANTAETIDVGIWLKPHNRAELDTLVEELYDSNSSHYHDWLKPEDIAAKFAPTAAEARTVAEFLSPHNLPVVEIGVDNFLVRGRGTIADVEKTFHVKIDMFELKGKTYRANTGDRTSRGRQHSSCIRLPDWTTCTMSVRKSLSQIRNNPRGGFPPPVPPLPPTATSSPLTVLRA